MTEHLGWKAQKAVVKRSNSRNGTSVKAIKSNQGELEINVPRIGILVLNLF